MHLPHILHFFRFSLLAGLLLSLPIVTNAQENRGNKLFDQFRYAEALGAYSKALDVDSANVNVLEKMAICNQYLYNWQDAELLLAKLVTLPEFNPEAYLRYGQVLKRNRKPLQARQQFEKYLAIDPSSFLGRLLLQSCNYLEEWSVTPPQYTVHDLFNLNTELSEFAPIVYKNGLVFTTERDADQVNDNNFAWSQTPYLSIYYAPFDDTAKTSFGKAKTFSNKINGDYHDGPLSVDTLRSVVYFTRVIKAERGRDHQNRMKIYSTIIKGKKLGKIIPFHLNSNDYSVGHPFLSPDGKRLYFVSDMEGSLGGMDIWYCQKEGEVWGTPINIGKPINTSGNEVFPSLSKSGELYFSSDVHPGYGGLDLFRSERLNNKWSEPENLRAPVNSPSDDFGICFLNDTAGFFSSDRANGVGKDDIYAFRWLPPTLSESTLEFAGVFEYDSLPASNVLLELLDDNDNVVARVWTDENGFFKFSKLDSEQNYLVRVVEEDANLAASAKLFMVNEEGKKVLPLGQLRDGLFTFRPLAPDVVASLEELPEDDYNMSQLEIFGQIFSKLPGDFSAGMEVYAVNDDGQIIAVAITDEKGRFVFRGLKPEELHLFKLDNEDANFQVVLLNKDGRITDVGEPLDKGNYRFRKLSKDDNIIALVTEAEEATYISGVFQYKGLPADNVELQLLDDNDQVIATVITDEFGRFIFYKLKADENYSVRVAEADDAYLQDAQLLITEQSGKRLNLVQELIDGTFVFTALPSKEVGGLGQMAAIDEEPYVSGTFKYKGLPADQVTLELLDENNEVVATVVTNENGEFSFRKLNPDQNYLIRMAANDSLDLAYSELNVTEQSGKPMNLVQSLQSGQFVFKALPVESVSGLSSIEANDLSDSPEEIGVFGQIYKTLPGDYPAGLQVYAVNDNGEIIAVAITDSAGKFHFKELDAEEHYLIRLAESDPNLKVSILNNAGKVLANTEMTEGVFVYYPLARDNNVIALIEAEDIARFMKGELTDPDPNTEPDPKEIKPDTAEVLIGNQVFPTIRYDFDEDRISKDDASKLDSLASWLKSNQEIRVAIASHTDIRGNAKYNMELSRRRTVATINYLIKQGVDPKQLEGQWFGETQPANRCVSGVWCPLEAHAENRRTEFNQILNP